MKKIKKYAARIAKDADRAEQAAQRAETASRVAVDSAKASAKQVKQARKSRDVAAAGLGEPGSGRPKFYTSPKGQSATPPAAAVP